MIGKLWSGKKSARHTSSKTIRVSIGKSRKQSALDQAKRLLNAKDVEDGRLNSVMTESAEIQKGKRTSEFAFGTVYDGLYKKREKVIVKELNFVVDSMTLKMIKKGILLNWLLKDCSYVLRMYGMCTLSPNKWIIITESTQFGSLNDLFNYNLHKKDKISMARKISAGMAYVHECDIIHKDIRSHNIMIGEKFEPKISGFEMSRENKNNTYNFDVDDFVKKWWSPERLKGYGSSKASDVYSFGLLMYEISVFCEPNNDKDMLKNEYGMMSKEYSKLIKECLNANPSERPVMNELVTKLIEQESNF